MFSSDASYPRRVRGLEMLSEEGETGKEGRCTEIGREGSTKETAPVP